VPPVGRELALEVPRAVPQALQLRCRSPVARPRWAGLSPWAAAWTAWLLAGSGVAVVSRFRLELGRRRRRVVLALAAALPRAASRLIASQLGNLCFAARNSHYSATPRRQTELEHRDKTFRAVSTYPTQLKIQSHCPTQTLNLEEQQHIDSRTV